MDELAMISVLCPDTQERERLWRSAMALVSDYVQGVDTLRVAPFLDPKRLRASLSGFDFGHVRTPESVLAFVMEGLTCDQLHTSHSRYFGLFNPAPVVLGAIGEAITAAVNPQLAAWSHSPFAVEVEAHLVKAFADRFGYVMPNIDGTFTSGGAEANHTGLLCALASHFTTFVTEGLRTLKAAPVLYVSDQAHHSWTKAARACGLGSESVRVVPVDERLQMKIETVSEMVKTDRAQGRAPFLIVATAGSTAAGVTDPIGAIAEFSKSACLWLHVDAAWGGAAVLLPTLKPLMAGIEEADSITFDPHKFLSVPMGAGLFITRHRDILKHVFQISTGYMPEDAGSLDITEPYAHSLQWSRRFIGLKLFLPLAVAGWKGYAALLQNQVTMGQLLRQKLRASGWAIVNNTELPVVCFRDDSEGMPDKHEDICRHVVKEGKVWISTVRLPLLALRACITNYRTCSADIEALVQAVNDARFRVAE